MLEDFLVRHVSLHLGHLDVGENVFQGIPLIAVLVDASQSQVVLGFGVGVEDFLPLGLLDFLLEDDVLSPGQFFEVVEELGLGLQIILELDFGVFLDPLVNARIFWF